MELRNKKSGFAKLREYVDGLVISQDLAKSICDLDVTEAYLGYVQELCRKLDSMNHYSDSFHSEQRDRQREDEGESDYDDHFVDSWSR